MIAVPDGRVIVAADRPDAGLTRVLDVPGTSRTRPRPETPARRRAAGAWSPGQKVKSYQWNTDATPIPGATDASYVPVADDRAHRLAVRVTGTASGYVSASVVSAATAPVAAGVIDKTPKPKIKGVARVGSRLTAVPGTWDPGVQLHYQWYAGTKKLVGKTSRRLALTTHLLGERIKVRVKGTKPGYESVKKTSAATAKVGAASRVLTGRPALASPV
jgi:hypothetical protein